MPILLTPENLLPVGLTINRPACEDSSSQTHTGTQTQFPFLYLALFGQTDGYEKGGVGVCKTPLVFQQPRAGWPVYM